MGNKGFIKRILPFFATFAVGVFIASFFVSISAPNFRRGGKCRHDAERMRMENEDLRNENLRLRNEMESLHWNSPHMKTSELDEMSPDVHLPVDMPPPPPAPPRIRR